jgi:general nucleoside transport system ATP-binding protein
LDAPAVQLDQVSRRFGPVLAVDSASATFRAGRVHAIVGENGAGKSTLLGLAGGTHPPDSGAVFLQGQRLHPATPREATRRGIGFVHQHFMLVEAFSALDNIILGAEPLAGLQLDRDLARKRARAVMDDAGLSLDVETSVDRLGVGERQTLEIVRVLYRGARVILLDEPTAVLTPGQSNALFATLRRLAGDDAAIVVVTHRLSEVMQHCDDVTVMRKGKVVSSGAVAETNEDALTRAIMGREPFPPMNRPAAADDAAMHLQVRELCVAGAGAQLALERLSLEVRAGHVVGLAGVEGNGQHELVQALAGLIPCLSGAILLQGRDITRCSVAARRDAGLAVMHADRHREGLMLDAPISDNLVLGDRGHADEAAVVAARIRRFGVVPAEPRRLARELSGGNQQKVVTARTLDRPLAALVLAQPTRGVDLGAARAIHEAIVDAVQSGAGALIVSADLAELRALCHCIHVIARGRIVATLPPDAPEDVFGRAMLGLGPQGGQAA